MAATATVPSERVMKHARCLSTDSLAEALSSVVVQLPQTLIALVSDYAGNRWLVSGYASVMSAIKTLYGECDRAIGSVINDNGLAVENSDETRYCSEAEEDKELEDSTEVFCGMSEKQRKDILLRFGAVWPRSVANKNYFGATIPQPEPKNAGISADADGDADQLLDIFLRYAARACKSGFMGLLLPHNYSADPLCDAGYSGKREMVERLLSGHPCVKDKWFGMARLHRVGENEAYDCCEDDHRRAEVTLIQSEAAPAHIANLECVPFFKIGEGYTLSESLWAGDRCKCDYCNDRSESVSVHVAVILHLKTVS